jgi:DNA polymerase III delta prime subunit
MRAQTHPDFLFIEPQEKTHSINIDQISELSEKLSRTAQCGGYQVVIISPADAMPAQAANALLKTLEEPTGKVIFFLIDHQQHYLPTTIMSRCQKIFFHSDEKIKSLLEKEHVALRDQLIQHLDLLVKRKANPITPVPQMQKNSETVLQLLLLICIDISRIQQQVSSIYLLSESHEKKLMSIANVIDPVALQEFINSVLEKLSFCSRGINLNQQLSLEDIFIQWEKLC